MTEIKIGKIYEQKVQLKDLNIGDFFKVGTYGIYRVAQVGYNTFRGYIDIRDPRVYIVEENCFAYSPDEYVEKVENVSVIY